jgi:hypothetical protein
MGHAVTAILGPQPVLEAFARRDRLPPPVPAKGGVWVLAMTDDAIDRVVAAPVGEPAAGFRSLFCGLVEHLRSASARSWLVYVETDYFGGSGGQGAMAFRDGAIVYGPRAADRDCINEALAVIGIEVAPPARDAFETVGLDLHRSTEDWLPPGDGDDA